MQSHMVTTTEYGYLYKHPLFLETQGASCVRFRDALIFLFNTASGIVFTVLALVYSPEFWPFIAYPILAAAICVGGFQKESSTLSKRASRKKDITMVPVIEHIWSVAGASIYLLSYIAFLVNHPGSLFTAILVSMFCVFETFIELGRFLARFVMRRRMQSSLSLLPIK